MKIQSIWVLVIFFSLNISLHSCNSIGSGVNSKIKNGEIYFFLKADNSKLSKNIIPYSINKKASHIGVIIKNNMGNFDVIQIHPKYLKNDGSIVISDLSKYLESEKENMQYFSIWKLKRLNNIKFKEKIFQYVKMKVKFDIDFNLTTDDELYCSEFLYKVLSDDTKYIQSPKKISSPILLSNNLDILEYYPVDFITEYMDVELVYEYIKK